MHTAGNDGWEKAFDSENVAHQQMLVGDAEERLMIDKKESVS